MTPQLHPSIRACLRALVAFAALSTACNSSAPSPTSATPVAPTPLTFPYPSFTLSGIITDSASGRPIRDVRVFVNGSPQQVRYTASDAAGRYETLGLPISTDPAWAQAAGDGWVQQCAVPVTMDGSLTTLNIQLTRRENLAQTSPPHTPPLGTRTISGRVFNNIDGVRTPVAGAPVDFEPDLDYVAALTFTDADGRFLLCGLPTTRLQLGASSTLAGTSVTVAAGGDATVDIELK